jgi:hypothetical protein
MANEKKMTIVEQFEVIIKKASNNEPLTKEEIKFLEARKETHVKKNANRKPTATQLANTVIAEDVIAYLKETGEHLQIKQMIKKIPCLARIADCTTQYVVGILRPYCESKGDGTIKKEEIKGTSYFYVPKED